MTNDGAATSIHLLVHILLMNTNRDLLFPGCALADRGGSREGQERIDYKDIPTVWVRDREEKGREKREYKDREGGGAREKTESRI